LLKGFICVSVLLCCGHCHFYDLQRHRFAQLLIIQILYCDLLKINPTRQNHCTDNINCFYSWEIYMWKCKWTFRGHDSTDEYRPYQCAPSVND